MYKVHKDLTSRYHTSKFVFESDMNTSFLLLLSILFLFLLSLLFAIICCYPSLCCFYSVVFQIRPCSALLFTYVTIVCESVRSSELYVAITVSQLCLLLLQILCIL
ncbi:hypothetical protein BD560DRAFT_478524 [Blakeslea trispora]|nr:hypothetical protein BD560DRAFT_478524 [Blakeslea trispora]